MTDFISSREAGERLGVSIRRAQEMAQQGKIPSVKIGRRIRIPRLAYEQWLTEKSMQAMSGLKEENRDAEAFA